MSRERKFKNGTVIRDLKPPTTAVSRFGVVVDHRVDSLNSYYTVAESNMYGTRRGRPREVPSWRLRATYLPSGKVRRVKGAVKAYKASQRRLCDCACCGHD